MTTKEYLEQVTIGKLSELSGRILLKEYNPAWATRYEEERRKISQALGQDGVAIEHVGSTSVPGLCAKPILDILLLVKDASVEGSYVPALVEAGYTLRVREPDWFGHRMLKGTSPEVNLHVFSSGCAEAQRMLDFRDWLRTHEDDRNLYANTKRNLAQQTWRYVQDYADAKSDVVRAVFPYAVVLKETGEPVGSAGIMFNDGTHSAAMKDGEAEIGYWIGVPYWGQGLIPEAVQCLLHRCFTDLNLSAVWCGR